MRKIEGLDCILLIDDDPSANFLHTLSIQSSGIDVRIQEVTGAREGLDFLECKGAFAGTQDFPRPGIIFLDINMPGMNGWDFLREYEKLPDPVKAKVVVAMLTTSLNPDDAERAKDMQEVKGFLNKPLTAELLERVIAENY